MALVEVAGLIFTAGSFVYAALTFHRKHPQRSTTATQSPQQTPQAPTTQPSVNTGASPTVQGVPQPEAGYMTRSKPARRSAHRSTPWLAIFSCWALTLFILTMEVAGFVNRDAPLGWLCLSAAGVGLVVAVPLGNRLDQSGDADTAGGVIGLLLYALPVLMILSIPMPSGVRIALFVVYGLMVIGLGIYMERRGR
jgi:hypothetical protein